MEWLIAGLIAVAMPVWAGLYLFRKLLKLRPLVSPVLEQLTLLARVADQVPELARRANALGDDPVIHVARRLELKRSARKLKRERSRRLSTRGF
jgi:hypothetical protein